MINTAVKMLTLFGLQFFADAGTVVNATANITNAYTGVETPRTEANLMAPELKAYYDTTLLENARTEMIYSQFALKQTMPKGHNGTVEWRRPNRFAPATELKEGVIPAGQEFGVTSLTGHVKQYGTYATVSDVLKLFSYDPIIDMMTKEMAASASETDEKLTRDSLLVNTNVMYCDNVARDGTYKSTPTTPATMGCSETDGYSMLTSRMISKAVTYFRNNRVPKIRGYYYCVVSPSVAFDLRNDPGWLEAHKYAKPEEIFTGEIGMLHGVRFVEDSFAPILGGTDYKNKSNGVTYACYMFGADSFGKIEAEGGNLQMIIKSEKEVGGPIEQFSTIGYKFMTNGGTILYPERLMRIMCCSTAFSATDTPN